MNIATISQINFKNRHAVTFELPGKHGTTLVNRIKIGAPARKGNLKEDILSISCDIKRNGKICENLSFKDKNGFDKDMFAYICEKLQEKIQEGINYKQALYKACAERFE